MLRDRAVRGERGLGVATRLLRSAVDVRDFFTNIGGGARWDARQVADNRGKLLGLKCDLDQSADRASRPYVGRADVLPRSFRLDHAAKVGAGRVENACCRERIAKPEDGRSTLFTVGEELELGVLHHFGKASDRFVDAPGAEQLLGLGDTESHV